MIYSSFISIVSVSRSIYVFLFAAKVLTFANSYLLCVVTVYIQHCLIFELASCVLVGYLTCNYAVFLQALRLFVVEADRDQSCSETQSNNHFWSSILGLLLGGLRSWCWILSSPQLNLCLGKHQHMFWREKGLHSTHVCMHYLHVWSFFHWQLLNHPFYFIWRVWIDIYSVIFEGLVLYAHTAIRLIRLWGFNSFQFILTCISHSKRLAYA